MAESGATPRRAASQDHAAFTESVKNSLANAREKVARRRRTDTQRFVTNVVSPAAATLIAALAAIGGHTMFKQAAAQSEDGGWVVACALIVSGLALLVK